MVFQYIIKCKKSSAAVIKYTIDHHFDFILMGDIEQGPKIFFPTQFGIDLKIVADVVAVIGGCLKNGIKIDSVDSQIQQIIDLLDYTAQIPSLKIPDGWLGSPGLADWVDHCQDRRSEIDPERSGRNTASFTQ